MKKRCDRAISLPRAGHQHKTFFRLDGIMFAEPKQINNPFSTDHFSFHVALITRGLPLPAVLSGAEDNTEPPLQLAGPRTTRQAVMRLRQAVRDTRCFGVKFTNRHLNRITSLELKL